MSLLLCTVPVFESFILREINCMLACLWAYCSRLAFCGESVSHSRQSWNPTDWFTGGTGKWMNNFSKDVPDVFKVWLPADLVCFSVPLFLRLPVRHIVSFVWTGMLAPCPCSSSALLLDPLSRAHRWPANPVPLVGVPSMLRASSTPVCSFAHRAQPTSPSSVAPSKVESMNLG